MNKNNKINIAMVVLIIVLLINGCILLYLHRDNFQDDKENHHSLNVTFVYYSDDWSNTDNSSIDRYFKGELFWNTTLKIDGDVVFSDLQLLVPFSAGEWTIAGSYELDTNDHQIEATCKETDLLREVEVKLKEDKFMLIAFSFGGIDIMINNRGFAMQ